MNQQFTFDGMLRKSRDKLIKTRSYYFTSNRLANIRKLKDNQVQPGTWTGKDLTHVVKEVHMV